MLDLRYDTPKITFGETTEMIVPDQFLYLSAFLFVERGRGHSIRKEPRGTTFFVGVKLDDEWTVNYAVTARHIIEDCSDRPYVFVRISKKDGGYDFIKIKTGDWKMHAETDVAICPIAIDPTRHIYRRLPMEGLATSDYVSSHGIAEGDEVFSTGLFVKHFGKTQNLPITRFGNISLMPREKISIRISDDETKMVDAYLVESRSWGGHSGEPVFFYNSPSRRPGMFSLDQSDLWRLLGLLQGYYELEEDVKFSYKPLKGSVPINTGISVVIPAQDIFDLFMREDVMKQKESIIDELKKRAPDSTPRPAGVTKEKTEPFTRDDFMRDLNKVVRKKSGKDAPKSDEENSQT